MMSEVLDGRGFVCSVWALQVVYGAWFGHGLCITHGMDNDCVASYACTLD